MASKGRELVKLESTGTNEKGQPTRHFYTTSIRTGGEKTEKIQIKKFDPRAHNPKTGKKGMHVIYKEKGKLK